MQELTKLLSQIEEGDDAALDRLLSAVYGELHRLASAKMRNELCDTLQVTELVNEAYMRLVDKDGSPHSFEGGDHFFGAASEAMRRILVERARRRLAQKRGGDIKRQEFDNALIPQVDKSAEIVAVHEALDVLAEVDPQAAELVKLRYFAGLPHKEAAEAMGVSKRVADRLWAVGRSWLFKKLSD